MTAQTGVARELPWDAQRGPASMKLFIVTEAMLFVCLLFSYFYLAHGQPHWPMDEPPKLSLALIMLVVLLASSATLQWSENSRRTGRGFAARAGVAATIALGLAFIGLQVLEYRDHLRTLLPTTDAYGSIFYTITTIHGAHVILGLAMLAYVLALPRLESPDRSPHRPLHTASLYWHFVDAVWVVIVAVLYVLPHLYRS